MCIGPSVRIIGRYGRASPGQAHRGEAGLVPVAAEASPCSEHQIALHGAALSSESIACQAQAGKRPVNQDSIHVAAYRFADGSAAGLEHLRLSINRRTNDAPGITTDEFQLLCCSIAVGNGQQFRCFGQSV